METIWILVLGDFTPENIPHLWIFYILKFETKLNTEVTNSWKNTDFTQCNELFTKKTQPALTYINMAETLQNRHLLRYCIYTKLK